MTDDLDLKRKEHQTVPMAQAPFGNFSVVKDTSRKGIEEHKREADEAIQQAFGKEGELPEKSSGHLGAEDYKESIDDQVKEKSEGGNGRMGLSVISSTDDKKPNWQEKAQKDFDKESQEIKEKRIKDGMQVSFDEDTETLKKQDALSERLKSVKTFDELLILLNDPEFPGIQGSRQFYSGEDLRQILLTAKASGLLNFITHSRGLRDVAEKLLLQEGWIRKKEDGLNGADVVGDYVAEVSKKESDNTPSSEKDSTRKEEPSVQSVGNEEISKKETGDASSSGDDSSKEKKPSIQDVKEDSKKENDAEKKKEPLQENHGSEQSLESLRNNVFLLKLKADAARNDFFSIKYREESGWKKVRSYFPFLKESNKASAVNDVDVLKGFWNVTLTEYKNARLELAKQEALKSEDKENLEKVLANTLQELELKNSIETYNAWKDSEWGGVKDSWYVRAVGRAKDWGESYRKLDWKKRIAVSAVLVGIGTAGVVTGSVGLVGLGATGSAIVRLLGSYGVGRGVYEYLEARANKNLLQKQEAEIDTIKNTGTVDSLESRLQNQEVEAEKPKEVVAIESLESRFSNYADRFQSEFDRRVRGNRNRVLVGATIGALLFAGGTAVSYANAFQSVEKITDGEKTVEMVQKIIASSQETDISANVSDTLSVSGGVISEVSPQVADSVPVPEIPDVAQRVSEVGGVASGVKDAIVEHGEQVAGIAKEAGKTIGEMAIIPKGSSVEGELIKYLVEQPNILSKEEAGIVAHRMVVGYVNTHVDVSLDEFSLVQPGTKFSILPNVGNERMPFKLGSIEFAPPGDGSAVIADHIPPVPALEVPEPIVSEVVPSETPLPSVDASQGNVSPDVPVSVPNAPIVTPGEPSDIFDTAIPSERAVSSHGPVVSGELGALGAGAGFAASGMAWDLLRKKKKTVEDSREKEKEEVEPVAKPISVSRDPAVSPDILKITDDSSRKEEKGEKKKSDNSTVDSENPPDIFDKNFSAYISVKEKPVSSAVPKESKKLTPPEPKKLLTHSPDFKANDLDISSVLEDSSTPFPWEKWKKGKQTPLLEKTSDENIPLPEPVAPKLLTHDSKDLDLPKQGFDERELLSFKNQKLLTHDIVVPVPVAKDLEVSENLPREEDAKEIALVKPKEAKKERPKGVSATSRKRRKGEGKKPANLNKVVLSRRNEGNIFQQQEREEELEVSKKEEMVEETGDGAGVVLEKDHREDREQFQEKVREVFLEAKEALSVFPSERIQAFMDLEDLYERFFNWDIQDVNDYDFDLVKKNVAVVLFGSDDVFRYTSILDQSFFDLLKSDKEKFHVGLDKAFGVFYGVFFRIGEPLAPSIVKRLLTREVIDLITKRLLTGKIPEELRDF